VSVATPLPTAVRPPAHIPGRTPSETTPASHAEPRDRTVIVTLAVCFAAIAALTWRKWGVPEIDAGAELTTADLVKHGAVAYQDVRYYYGPLGLYSLALSFKLLGTSFATAYAFGLVQAAAIIAVFYALARRWLKPLYAGLASVVLIAIGFSGTEFNFVLPHTNSATFGLFFLLAMLLALTHERSLGAGVALGLIGLTRPEFFAVAVAGAAAYVLVTWRLSERSRALRAAWRLALPGILLPALVLGWFAMRTGLGNLLNEDLWPTTFIKVGAKTESNWMPLTLSGLLGLVARGAIYLGLLAALVTSVQGWRQGQGRARIWKLWPLAAVAVAIALVDAALRASGLLAGQRHAIERELHHLIIGMSWLPALGVVVAALAAFRLLRREASPLGGAWPVDCALIVVGAALGLRAYNAFTAEGSYAPYYAAPLVLLLGILHQRVAERWPLARPAAWGALALVAAGLFAFSVGGLYVHDTTTVHTPRGSFVTTRASATALQPAVAAIDRDSGPGQTILAAPTDGGLYFMADRRPALHELTLLPGLLATPAAEAAAVARLRREHVALAVIGARDLSVWGTPTFGVDYYKPIGAYLQGSATMTTSFGSLTDPSGGTIPSKGFTIQQLSSERK
jgi:4-amino-4-deoxy-L-arabinose transferase-like glycosyltransferase